MKFAIFAIFLAIAVIASPTYDAPKYQGDYSADNYAEVPDGFGGMKLVNLDEEQAFDPFFNPPADIRFLLFTRSNPTVGQLIRFDDMNSVASSHFSSTRPTKFIAHGWQSNANTAVNIMTRDAYLRTFDVNVIVVDWSVGASNPNYVTSRGHVNSVGEVIARFLDNLRAANLLPDFSRVTCIGQSLGAHVCGAAGKRVTLGRINTIIGLDPAGPLFLVGNPTNRLDSGDAEYVENIHTDTVQYGIGAPIGHTDWFPNGGSNMPATLCDHAIAANYFADSINSNLLWGRTCISMAAMNANLCFGAGASMGGEPSNFRLSLRGIFRMATNPSSPFGQGPF